LPCCESRRNWEERGYADIEKNICEDRVEDDFLKDQIRGALADRSCDYCGKHAKDPIAAPVEVILEPIVRAIGYSHRATPRFGGTQPLCNPTCLVKFGD
jgi:hypothetical protein